MVVVTGATGHLGGVLVRRLIDAGETVRVITRRQSVMSGLEGLPVEIHDTGLLDTAALERAFSGASVVYHAAALISFAGGSTEELHRVNVDGTRAVLDAARNARIGRFVHVGSIETFPLTLGKFPITEASGIDPLHTVMEYGKTKALSTQMVLDAAADGLDAVVVCPTSFLGPPDFRLSPVGRLIRDFALGRLPAVVDGGFDFVDVRDVADGTLRAAEFGRTGECYLLSGRYTTLPQMMEMLREMTGLSGPKLCLPTRLILPFMPLVEMYYRIAGRPPRFTRDSLHIVSLHATVDSSKARDELGYSPRPLTVTLSDTLSWFRQAGMIPPEVATTETE